MTARPVAHVPAFQSTIAQLEDAASSMFVPVDVVLEACVRLAMRPDREHELVIEVEEVRAGR